MWANRYWLTVSVSTMGKGSVVSNDLPRNLAQLVLEVHDVAEEIDFVNARPSRLGGKYSEPFAGLVAPSTPPCFAFKLASASW